MAPRTMTFLLVPLLLAALSASPAAAAEAGMMMSKPSCPRGCYRTPTFCPIECRAARSCRLQGRNITGKQRYGYKCVPHRDTACATRCTPYPRCAAARVARVTARVDGEGESCRFRTCAMGNLVADALLARGRALGATLALVNGGSIRGSFDAADVSYADIEAVLPFDNDAVVVTVRGSVVVAALENGLRMGAPRFPQIAGMVVRADLMKPQGTRVRGVTVGGMPIYADKLYRVATSSFIAGGGDEYMWPGAEVVAANECTTKVVLLKYLRNNSPYTPNMEPRIINTFKVVAM